MSITEQKKILMLHILGSIKNEFVNTSNTSMLRVMELIVSLSKFNRLVPRVVVTISNCNKVEHGKIWKCNGKTTQERNFFLNLPMSMGVIF